MNFKKLKERKALLQKEMSELLKTANSEERALNEEEVSKFEKAESEIKDIDKTLELEKRANLNLEEDVQEEERGTDKTDEAEERAFANYIRGIVEERAAVTLNKSDNGAVVPASIAKKIIEQVVTICPIFADAERFNVAGTLTIPYYDETSSAITVGYATEGTAATSATGKLASIELKGYLINALTDISKSLINNSSFDITSFVVRKMAQALATFIEKEIVVGTTGKITGLSTGTNTIIAASATAVTADELIELQEAIADEYQAGAYFIMNKATRTAIRKLKDGQGNYLLNKDANSRWGYTLFGKDVYTSSNMPTMAADARAIHYLNPAGVAVKVSEDISIELLREIKAAQHQVEAIGFAEVDAKIQNEQMVATLVMKSAS